MDCHPSGCTDLDMSEMSEQHTWGEWQDFTHSCSFFFFFLILSLITYLVVLLFKKQCLLSLMW